MNISIVLLIGAGFSLAASSPWLHGAGFGALYGLLTALVVFFGKGGFRSKDTPFIIIVSLIVGVLIGVLVVNYGF